MESDILLSLCIPTNGILEWVLPVLDSIYQEKNPISKFEVIITDNGSNKKFETTILDYASKHRNLVYKKTNAYMFLNQIEAFKIANGQLIKFINHRMKLLPGALNYLMEYVRTNCKEKPITYFLNGVVKLSQENTICKNFDEYVRTLSYWSSWSAGTAIWKSNFNRVDLNQEFNELFPHMDIIFSEKCGNKYVINNKIIVEEIPGNIIKKGRFDLFNAFAVEYINILKKLLDNGNISFYTYKFVKEKNRQFIAKLYYDYIIKKIPCSYDLSGFKKAIKIYYSEIEIKKEIPKLYFKTLYDKYFYRN